MIKAKSQDGYHRYDPAIIDLHEQIKQEEKEAK